MTNNRKTTIRRFFVKNSFVDLYIPNENETQLRPETGATAMFWAKVWPSAYAISEHLLDNHAIISSATVLELGAGLGLPSFIAAKYAKFVYSSDIQPDAVELMDASVKLNRLKNMKAVVADWSITPLLPPADIIIMSDVSYDPGAFDLLEKTIRELTGQGSTIILSSPHRLSAKPFIRGLHDLISEHIITAQLDTDISIFHLKNSSKRV